MAKHSRKDPVPLLEWVAAAIGLVIALALLGTIGLEAIRGTDRQVPVLEPRVLRIESSSAGHVVLFEVANRSGQTAAAVQVMGTAGGEESQAALDYVPGRSEAKGGLLFSRDPRGQKLEIRVTGYQQP